MSDSRIPLPLPLASDVGLIPAGRALDAALGPYSRALEGILDPDTYAALRAYWQPHYLWTETRDALRRTDANGLPAYSQVDRYLAWISEEPPIPAGESVVHVAALARRKRAVAGARRKVDNNRQARKSFQSWSQILGEYMPQAVAIADTAATAVNEAANTAAVPTIGGFPSWH